VSFWTVKRIWLCEPEREHTLKHREQIGVLTGLVCFNFNFDLEPDFKIFEIIWWPLFQRYQLYDQDIPEEKIDFGETCVRQIDAIQFPAKFSCETANVIVNFMLGMHST
jgi:hypothetical protein